ncbi:PQQ-dependent sugar dehydrogenase [Halocatena salina]|uniref:PQQ-dependent sugar dehydrogenase n=1 Tax=Halocatena salina TaxID=2934340 RepID=A0A8T9ZZC5_9EURY|nr:PQQ-dependent sugar dehydrogenase [Halocatena salina]UPM41789.1 PQQ-dependent sugar dehydrogenase [Halocatena salina]
MKRRTYLHGVAIAVAAAGCMGHDDTSEPSTSTKGNGTRNSTETVSVETVVENLEVPWGVAYRGDTLYVTERPGRVVRVNSGESEVVADFTGNTTTGGEGGLLGLAFHPTNSDVAFTYQTYGANERKNRIVRHDVANGWDREPVLDGIPGGRIHDGGRLFVHDEALFATTGDASHAEDAQNPQLLNGKVLRLTLDGRPHPDNPFGNAVFTYGHRNPEGLAARNGTMYAIEHGPDSDDEINQLEPGANYGWPEVTGPSDTEEFTDPVTTYEEIIAPGGGVFYDGPIEHWQGDLFVGTLAGTHLRRIRIQNGTVTEDEKFYDGKYGRLRTTFTGPEDHLYVTTSNRDGRGTPNSGDDKILKLRSV